MKSTLILALDRTGRLQTACWGVLATQYGRRRFLVVRVESLAIGTRSLCAELICRNTANETSSPRISCYRKRRKSLETYPETKSTLASQLGHAHNGGRYRTLERPGYSICGV